VKSGKVAEKAHEAEHGLDTPERRFMERAEETGKPQARRGSGDHWKALRRRRAAVNN
jgi:hypothetical protein